jgi:N-methylhydantoinase A
LPLVGAYVERLAGRLADAGVQVPLHLMQGNGGVATAEQAAGLPVSLLASGPAAGVIGAARLGELLGEHELLTFDMGGTTADVALVEGGRPSLRFRGEVAGHPVALPQIDVLSVGAGGGSIASVDRFGALTVGPSSAGAEPGPASYGLGGDEATVTDAHVVLATLDPARFLGGRMTLDVRAARRAVERRVARPLGLSLDEAARAVLRIADAAMVRALHVISVARGRDPRRAALVAFGGAGPMHACSLADALGARRVLVPRHPGVTSALGLLLTDVRHDVARTWIRPTQRVRIRDLESQLTRLEREARELLAGAGFGNGRGRIEVELEMRYRGQAYELPVAFRGRPVTSNALRAVEERFHETHRRVYGHDRPVDETEIVTLRVRGIGPATYTLDGGQAGGRPRRSGSRGAFAVYERDAVGSGRLSGPVIVEQDDSTLVVPKGWRLRPGVAGTLLVERGGAR